MPILQAGALYFALTFAAGWVLGPIREFWVIPRLGRTVGFFLEAPLMLVVSVLVARWVVRRFAVPPTLPTRALVGLVALGMLLVAELLGAWGLRGLSPADYLASFGSRPGAVTAATFLLFAAMPLLIGRLRNRGRQERS
jgi:hypothetical protein